MASQDSNFPANASADRTKRSSNFATKEVKHLIQLVDSRKEIIESKKTDRATSDEKIKAWMEIEKDFNAEFDQYRSFKVLKTKYENLKHNIKRKLRTNVSNLGLLKLMQTNENVVTNEPLSDCDNDCLEDQDTLHNSDASEVDIKPPPPLNEEELDAAAEQYVFETLLFGDAKSPSPTMTHKKKLISRPPDEEQIKTAKRNIETTVDIWEEVAHKKLKKLELETNVIEEEWRLRKHKLELEIENVKIENHLLKQKLQNYQNNSS